MATTNLKLTTFGANDYIKYTDFNNNWNILDKLGNDYICQKKIQKGAGKWSYVCFQNSGLMIQWMVDWGTGRTSETYSAWGTAKQALHCTRKFQMPAYAKAFAQEPWSQVVFSGAGSGVNKWCSMVAVCPSTATRQKPPSFQLIDAYNANKSIPKPTFSCLAVGFWK